jgi:hypothetical protein
MTTYCVCASIHDAIKTLESSLIRQEAENKSKYYELDKGMDKSLRDQFHALIMECHLGELPNNWRYEVVKDLCVSFLEYWGEDDKPELEDYQDIIPEVADNIASIYNSELFQWLADYPNRAVFEDDQDQEVSDDLSDIARCRQVEEIRTMAYVLVDGLSEMSS